VHRGQYPLAHSVTGGLCKKHKEAANVVTDHPTELSEEYSQQYTIPKYPPPYFRGQTVVSLSVKQRKHLTVRTSKYEKSIYHNDFYVVKRLMDAELGECVGHAAAFAQGRCA